MTWTAPPTFVSGTALTAAQLNIIGADLNETAPAKASAVGQYFVATGVNAIAARTPQQSSITTGETTTATSFTDLATVGPQVAVTCGTGAYCLVLVNSLLVNSVSGATASVGVDISGATTIAASTIYLSLTTSAANQQATMGACRMQLGMTGGVNTFTMKYVVGAGTGTFSRRHLTVLAFG
jgi:hypothetical protein